MHQLTQNICLDQTLESVAFAAWLLDIGSGKNLPWNMMITLPTAIKVLGNNVEGLVNVIYLQISHGVKLDEYFLDKTILVKDSQYPQRIGALRLI
jgi:hypothetical protein